MTCGGGDECGGTTTDVFDDAGGAGDGDRPLVVGGRYGPMTRGFVTSGSWQGRITGHGQARVIAGAVVERMLLLLLPLLF